MQLHFCMRANLCAATSTNPDFATLSRLAFAERMTGIVTFPPINTWSRVTVGSSRYTETMVAFLSFKRFLPKGLIKGKWYSYLCSTISSIHKRFGDVNKKL
jgi:hypothetical protein